MDERPIRQGIERLGELGDETIPAETDNLRHQLDESLADVRRVLDLARVTDVASKVEQIVADMCREVEHLRDASTAAVSTATSELKALLRPVLHVTSTQREHQLILRDPPEDHNIVVDRSITYGTGVNGRVISVKATLAEGPAGKRNPSAQRRVKGKLDQDDAGHLIGRVFGGIGDDINLVPMTQKVNRRSYRGLEREWERAIRDGMTIDITVWVVYTDDGHRPAYFEVEYEIGDEIESVTILNTPADSEESDA